MTKEKILELIENAPPADENFGLSDVVNISEYIQPKLIMDEYSFEYFYSIGLNELAESAAGEKEILDLFRKGWVYDENNESLTRKL